jgi:hypothetical protein
MNVQRVASDYDFQAWGMFDRWLHATYATYQFQQTYIKKS